MCVTIIKRRQAAAVSTTTEMPSMATGNPSAPVQTNMPVIMSNMPNGMMPHNVMMPHNGMMPPTVMYSNNPMTTGLYVQPPVLMPVYMGTNQ